MTGGFTGFFRVTASLHAGGGRADQHSAGGSAGNGGQPVAGRALVDGIASIAIAPGLYGALIRCFARKPALPEQTGAATPAISPHLP